MSHSQEGPAKATISIGQTKYPATKERNRWTAAGLTAKTGLFFGDDLALKELEQAIAAKASRKGGTKPSLWTLGR